MAKNSAAQHPSARVSRQALFSPSRAWKVQRICILNTDSLTKSGKSTDSFTLLGKIYRFFAEIRRVKDRLRGPEFLSLKAALCLSKFTQTWREKPANSSDLVHFSGKSFRHGEKIRLHKSAHETNLGFKSHVTKGPPEKCKESVFWIQILCRNQANPPILLCF